MSFGSIDVPSVVEQHDLELFCLLDRQHSQCVDECGYAVQFNLREYVCKRRFDEVIDPSLKGKDQSWVVYCRCWNTCHATPELLQFCQDIVVRDAANTLPFSTLCQDMLRGRKIRKYWDFRRSLTLTSLRNAHFSILLLIYIIIC